MEKNHNSALEPLRRWLFSGIGSEGRRLRLCLAATFLLGLLAHGYGFLHLLISHDSLHEFYWAVSRDWKLTLGRFMEPVLRYLMGEIVVLPWLTGLMGLLFIGLAAHLMSKLFSLNKVWENILLAGICATNVTVTALIATYIHDFAGDMLALLLCTAAAWCYHQMKGGFSWKHTFLGAVCLGASFGLYQAYLAVLAAVMCIYAIMDLLRGTGAKQVILHLLRALPMGVLAVGLYGLGLLATRQLFCIAATSGDPVNDISLVGGNLLSLPSLIAQGYRQVIQDLFIPYWDSVRGVHSKASALVALINAVLFLHAMVLLLTMMKKKALKAPEIILIFVLLLLLPLAMTCVSIVSTAFHSMVRYAYYLYYLLVLVLFSESRRCPGMGLRPWQAPLILGLILIVLFNNIQVSNTAYEKKELEQQATLSNMTRLLSRLEEYEDYVYGQSEVAILGDPRSIPKPLAVGHIRGIMGLYNTSPLTTPDTIADYFEIVLQYPINLSSHAVREKLKATEEYRQLDAFPARDCIATIDGIIVIKLS